MSEVRKTVDAETLLATYVDLFNANLTEDGNSTATFQDVANTLDMTVDNVYQRILKIRTELKPQGIDLPLMKRNNEPRKTVKRISLNTLASIAQSIGK